MKKLDRRIQALLRSLLVLALLFPLAYAVYHQWLEVRLTLATVAWGQVVLALLAEMLLLPLMGMISWITLRYLGQAFSLFNISNIYFLSQAAKYLPGGIWAFPGRVVAYQAVGVEKTASFISMVREVSILFLGAALVGFFGLSQYLVVPDWVRLTVSCGVLACGLVILFSETSWFWRVMARMRWARQVRVDNLSAKSHHFSLKWLPVSLLVSLAFWLFTGIAFRLLAVGVTPMAESLSWLQSASIFALAWSAGFVIVPAPAGLGVRESALSAMLVNHMPAGQALSIALVARLWWTCAEAGFILFALAWTSRAASRLRPEITGDNDQARATSGQVIASAPEQGDE